MQEKGEKSEEEDYRLELRAELLNIGGDNNKALKNACRTLREYAAFTDKMRKYTKMMDIEAAAEYTIEECIREDVLREFLTKHRAEVKTVSIFEYDQEKHIRQEREQAWEEGRETGLAEGEKNKLKELIQKKLQKGKTPAQIADELEEEQPIIEELIKNM